MNKKVLTSLTLALPLVFGGCYGVIAAGQQALSLGTQAYGLIENTDINGAKSPNFTKEDFEEIKKIAISFKKKSNNQQQNAISLMGSNSSNLDDVFMDNFSTELMKLGIDVIDRSIMPNLNAETQYNGNKLTDLGVNALVIGSITTTSNIQSSGFSGVKMSSLVSNASVKIVNTQNGSTMMSLNVSYKNGQKPVDVAEELAKLLKAVVTYPDLKPQEAYEKMYS
jgi:hypothetical protein